MVTLWQSLRCGGRFVRQMANDTIWMLLAFLALDPNRHGGDWEVHGRWRRRRVSAVVSVGRWVDHRQDVDVRSHPRRSLRGGADDRKGELRRRQAGYASRHEDKGKIGD